MFKREYHQKILTVLNHLNADFLAKCQTYLGGGTLVSLNCDEHRLCRSLTFRCQKGQKYSLLRSAVGESGYHALFTKLDDITLPREIQFHQHGFRFPVVVASTPIKWQVLIENQFRLAPPNYPNWSPVACLDPVDCIADKLLANSDRWNKPREKSRDLIDLTALRLTAPFPEVAWQQAEEVFPIFKYLQQAIQHFQQQPDYRAECYQALQVKNPKAIIDGLDLLATDLGLVATERTASEWGPVEIAYPEPSNSPNGTDTESAPLEIPAKLPFLKAVSWHIRDVKRFTPIEMLGQYEDGWKYRGALGEPSSEELQFIKKLIQRYESWLVVDV